MKILPLLSLCFVLANVAPLHAETFTFSGINQAVPDGNPTGLSNTQTVSSAITSIGLVTVGLNLTGGFNGDIYAYVTHSTAMSTLLNRVGKTAGDPFGYPDSGFMVTFSDSAVSGDIHYYRTVIPGGSSPVTGTWQPDARTADPGVVTDASPRTAFLSSFNGLNPNGDWTLFIADLSSGGGTATLVSWSLDIQLVAVPEGATWIFPALLIGTLASSRREWRRWAKARQGT